MTDSARRPGKRGRLPVKPPAERFPLHYVDEYARTPLPAPSYPVDVRGGIADDDWEMCGNGPDPSCTTHPDGVGDCGFAAREHLRYAKAACYGEAETRETSDALVAEYLAYDHGKDEGVVLADALLAWYRAGKILAFAPVDHTDPAAVDSAMAAFRGLYVGVDLTDDADALFGEGRPWTVADGQQPDETDGHCIVKVTADGKGLDGYVTWGRRQAATEAWGAAALREAWVIISSEDEAAKVYMADLTADIEVLGGTGPGKAAGMPAPDHLGQLRELAGLVREVAASVDRDISEVVSWLRTRNL